ncbi:MAG: ParB/RepB/Spo0J family partition protein [Bacteroidota bacterium]|nr:ParB/RepB/Spo0J family partition protein [Bacteroidota bacterium]
MIQKKNSLGRGLNAILGDPETDIMSRDPGISTIGQSTKIDITQIEPNPFQPRKNFDEEALLELSKSIAAQGVIQAITVRKLNQHKYQIVSGERRFRASQLAGLTEIPVTIIVASDKEMLEKALVENIQREDLNAVEVAESYQRLIDECKYTHEALSEKVGKSRTVITNFLRLLKLPIEIQQGIIENKISTGHARALISLNDYNAQIKLYNDIIQNNLNVRSVEDSVRELNQKKDKPEKVIIKKEVSLKQQQIRDDISSRLGRNVTIKKNNDGNGNILIPFNSDEDLESILELLN